jgi:hypothetical protein
VAAAPVEEEVEEAPPAVDMFGGKYINYYL